MLLIGMKMPQDCASEKVNGSLPEKSKPLMKARYKPLAHEAKMPEARFSKAPAILNREFQLDIWNKLSVPTGTFVGKHMVAYLLG